MNGPSACQCAFWAKTAISVAARTFTASSSDVNGGQTTTSTPSRPSRRSRRTRQNSSVSGAVLSPASSYMTGSVIVADGGQSAVNVGMLALDLTRE